uniref:HAD family hydrolase n=1 Tax=Thaumasiovibrio occultus TaxID=1891184 RepID=UPI000B359A23|nr:HAD family phosphatase [Thaumasiovibrio occultus]
MQFKAAVFDMDGLLLDTERVCFDIFEQACHAQNVPFLSDVYLSCIGCNSVGVERIMRAGYGPDLDYRALNDEWRQRYTVVVMNEAIPMKSGVIAMLEWLKANGIPAAVATSTQREVAEAKLRLSGLMPYFQSVTTGCEVEQGKPHPEIYLLAASRLGVEPTDCIAFEDSNNGVKSAVAANMTTFQIPDLVAPSDEVKALGHHIHPSMDDVLQVLQQNARVKA